jgi:hypothetical protein
MPTCRQSRSAALNLTDTSSSVDRGFIAEPNYELQIQERLTLMPRDFRLGLRLRAD